MKIIEERPEEPRRRIDSESLERLARFLSGRIQMECGKCRNSRRLTVHTREMRLGSSPDLSAIDPSQPGRPRIIFYCLYCNRPIGFIQGDDWASPDAAAASGDDEATRWDYLEIDEAE